MFKCDEILTTNLCGKTSDKNGTCKALPATRTYLSQYWFVLVNYGKHQVIATTIIIRSIRVFFVTATCTWVTRTRITFINFRFLCHWWPFDWFLGFPQAVQCSMLLNLVTRLQYVTFAQHTKTETWRHTLRVLWTASLAHAFVQGRKLITFRRDDIKTIQSRRLTKLATVKADGTSPRCHVTFQEESGGIFVTTWLEVSHNKPVVSCLIFAMDLLESIFQDVQFKDKDRVFEVLLEEGVSSL